MRKRLLTLGVAVIGGVAGMAAQLIATPQQLGVYDNVEFVRQTAPNQTSSKCAKAAAARKKTLQFINFSGGPDQKVQ